MTEMRGFDAIRETRNSFFTCRKYPIGNRIKYKYIECQETFYYSCSKRNVTKNIRRRINKYMNEMSTPFVSVIIPVYNDPIRLETCLQALEEQTYPKSSYEVIVVDNGSDESIEPIVVEFPGRLSRFLDGSSRSCPSF